VKYIISLVMFLMVSILSHTAFGADSNTVATTSTTSTTSGTVTGTTTVDRTPSTAVAPNIIINNQDVCTTGISGAAQSAWFGISMGKTIKDLNCERLKLARSLYGMGMKVASVSLLCQDVRVFKAMEMAGTPCPINGKIGQSAKEEWAKDPTKRPDYDEWKDLKENQEKVAEINSYHNDEDPEWDDELY
jgi:hypothetical protein